ncbi:MAG: flagellar hook-associated protein FlgK [Parvularculaceae bacterium]
MSLNVVVANAVGGLLTSQTALRTTSENVSNVNNENYVRRETKIGNSTTDGRFSIVQVDEIRRIVDEFLVKESRIAVSQAAGAARTNEVLDRLQALFGAPGDGSALPARLEDVFTSISNLTIDPNSPARRIDLLGDLQKLADSLNRLFDQIVGELANVDRALVDNVTQVNAIILELHQLNASIGAEELIGISDQQDALLARLSEYVDVRSVRDGQGRLQVYTSNGLALVDQGYARLNYNGVSPIDESVVFPNILIETIHPGLGQPIGSPSVFDKELQSGSIRALLDLRDVELPAFGKQVGAASALIADRLNAVHNENVASPPPNTLIGRNTGLLGTDAINFTGATTLAVVRNDGTLQHRIDIDFDAGTLSVNGGAPAAFSGGTLADLIGDLNAALGATGTATFVNGVLTIDAANANDGVAFLEEQGPPLNPSDRAGRTFSHFFGLNDLVTASSPTHFSTGLAGTDAHGFTPGQTIDFVVRAANGNQVRQTFTIPAGATFNDIVTALNNPVTGLGFAFSFSLSSPDGVLSATPAAGALGSTLFVESDNSLRGGTATTLTDLFGLGPGPVMAQAKNVAIKPAIEADPGRLALAKLDLSGAPIIGDTVLTGGDNRGALAFEALQNQTFAVGAVGHLPATTTTITQFSERVLSDFAVQARSAQDAHDGAQALKEELIVRRNEVQGVNLDEELAQMLVFQQSFNAAARVMTSASELFDALINAV